MSCGGPRMTQLVKRPITDIVCTEKLIGSSTQAAPLFASSARSFPSCIRSRVSHNINFRRRNPHGFKTLCRRVALCGN